MSYLSDLMNKRITFSTFAAESAGWVTKVFNAADPKNTTLAGAVLSDVKQAGSDAISLGDTLLGELLSPAVAAVEAAADAALLRATGGIAAPAIPMVNAGIDRMAVTLKSAIDIWALKQKANLTPVGGGSGTTSQSS